MSFVTRIEFGKSEPLNWEVGAGSSFSSSYVRAEGNWASYLVYEIEGCWLAEVSPWNGEMKSYPCGSRKEALAMCETYENVGG